MRGYYALPLLWRDRVIGWGNVAVKERHPARRSSATSPDGPRASARSNARSTEELERLRTVPRRRMKPRPAPSPEIEDFRDERWRREGARQIETAFEAERFIEQVGFTACMTDSRRPGPSLYVAVCGRRDAVMPRNVQKDPGGVRDVGPEGRAHRARQGVLRQALTREGDVPGAADDSVLQRRLGREASRGEAPPRHDTRARS